MDNDSRQKRFDLTDAAMFDNPACTLFLLLACLLYLFDWQLRSQRITRNEVIEQDENFDPPSDDPSETEVVDFLGAADDSPIEDMLIQNPRPELDIPIQLDIPIAVQRTPTQSSFNSEITDNARYSNLNQLALASTLTAPVPVNASTIVTPQQSSPNTMSAISTSNNPSNETTTMRTESESSESHSTNLSNDTTTSTPTESTVSDPMNTSKSNSSENGHLACENNQSLARPTGRSGDDDSIDQLGDHARNNSSMAVDNVIDASGSGEIVHVAIEEHVENFADNKATYCKKLRATTSPNIRKKLREEYVYFLNCQRKLLLGWQTKSTQCAAAIAPPLSNLETEFARVRRNGWDVHNFPCTTGPINYSKDIEPAPLSTDNKLLYDPLHHGEVRLWKKNGNNCCLDAMNNAVAINNFVTKSDVASCWSKKTPIVESFGLIDTALKQKENTPYRLNKMDKPNHTFSTPKIDSFHKLFQLRHGIYLVSLHVKNKTGESVLHAITFNASANFISDGAFRKVIDITEDDRSLSSDQLEAKLQADFKYFQFVHVYQVRAHRTQIVRGNIPHHKATLPKGRMPIILSSPEDSNDSLQDKKHVIPPSKKRSIPTCDGPSFGTRSSKRPKVFCAM